MTSASPDDAEPDDGAPGPQADAPLLGKGWPNPQQVALEPGSQAFAEGAEILPYLSGLAPVEGRRLLEEIQAGRAPRPDVDEEWLLVDGAPTGPVSVRVVRPPGAAGPLPVVLYVHGGGWVFGSANTHDRLVRELAVGTGAAVVFPEYDLSPEARYPTALEQCYAVARWLVHEGSDVGLDGARMAVAGDQMGGAIAAALALLAAERGDVVFSHQVLFYPATDAGFATESYRLFAVGYTMRAEQNQWYWDQYAPDPDARRQPTASPLRASLDQLAGCPPALVVTAEADCLRDEGEAFAARLRSAGVPVLAIRYAGVLNGFVMIDVMRGAAATSAVGVAVAALREALAP